MMKWGAGKTKRRTIGFGKEDVGRGEQEIEIYIKELSIIDGGIGAGVWEASIMLSKWILFNSALFGDLVCLELGSGCGLSGIIMGSVCKKCILTDYIDGLVKNMVYNVTLNSNVDEYEDFELKESETLRKRVEMRKRIRDSCVVKILDWYDVETSLGKEKIEKEIGEEKFKLIFGSELTYTNATKTGDIIVLLLDYLMAKDGCFVEILSDNREGVDYFLQKCEGVFEYKIFLPKKEFLYEKVIQRKETYKYYVFKRNGEASNLFDDICKSFC